MIGLLIVPLYKTIRWSFEEVSYGSPGTWVGLDNYSRALTDDRFLSALVFTTGLTITTTAVIVVLAYVLAVMVNRLTWPRPIVLGVLLIPYVIPSVVGSAAYSWLFDSNFGGVVNYLISLVSDQQILWFTDVWPNRILLMSNIVWSMLPFAILMILAGLQGVPKEIIEAGTMDGANLFQRHWNIIIPSIRGIMGFVLLILIMDIFRVFDQLIPLSPAAAQIGNESVMLYVFNIAFREGSPQLGLGSAVNILSIIVILVLLYPSIRGVLKEASGRE
ncbi:carbohydrate ABC transporter permease [Corynebacterium crudilactis]|nr:sugar ABC transporter permease [Corynebacterium crudilactis]